MKIKKNSKLNLGILVDTPFPHPTGKDQKGIKVLSFEQYDCVFNLFTALVIQNEYSLGEKLLKASERPVKHLQNAFATDCPSEYKNEMDMALDALTEIRFWLKEVQMKYICDSVSDEAVARVNELITIINYIAGKVNPTVSAGILTVN
jgi:hypothetical protein